MRFAKYLIALTLFASMQLTFASETDIMDLVGGSSVNFSVGWFGEAYVDSAKHWCGDTTYKDLTKDTTIVRDTMRFTTAKEITDTIKKTTGNEYVVRDTLVPDSSITADTTINDSTTVFTCDNTTFVSETGAFTPGAQYMNYFYKFRNWYAQLPFVWNGWAGRDATGYKKLLITYKGLLPTHQMSLNFFYAAWGSFADTTKDKNRGDGIAVLQSTTEWKTEVITIPDSVDMVGITGINIGISNTATGGGKDSSALGNLKVERISLLPLSSAVQHFAPAKKAVLDRFQFMPKTAGNVSITVYSLNGVELYNKSINVAANKVYSLKQLANQFSAKSSQVKILRIKGAGVEMNQPIR